MFCCDLAAPDCLPLNPHVQCLFRRLILMRHATSQEAGPTKDHDRPILPEGAQAAKEVRSTRQTRQSVGLVEFASFRPQHLVHAQPQASRLLSTAQLPSLVVN